MSFGTKNKVELEIVKARTERSGSDVEDAALEQALGNFRLSVHAWSESVFNRPRTIAHEVRHRSWQLAAGLALSAALVGGSFTGVVHERHLRQEAARQEAAERVAAQQQRAQEAQQARVADRELLTNVDSDVSREVPSAMEPLAQLMDVSDTN
jgi:hypothetical protein